MTGYFLAGIEVPGAVDHAVNVGLAVAPLGHEPLRRLPACLPQGRRVGLLQRADQRSVLGAAELGHRRQVDAGVGIDQEPAIGRQRHLVRAVAFGQDHQAGAVEVHPRMVDVIGVLSGTDAAGAEPDLPLGLVDAVHSADDPFAPGDRVLDRSRPAVVEVEVIPAVALRGPDDLAGLRARRAGTASASSR